MNRLQYQHEIRSDNDSIAIRKQLAQVIATNYGHSTEVNVPSVLVTGIQGVLVDNLLLLQFILSVVYLIYIIIYIKCSIFKY